MGSNADEAIIPGRNGHLTMWERVQFSPQRRSVSMACSSSCVALADHRVCCFGPVHTAEGGAISDVVLDGSSGVEDDRVQLCAGSEYHCALLGGRVWCWGYNRSGQVRETPLFERATVARVRPMAGVVGASGLYCGSFAACATTSARQLTCWGSFAHFLAPESSQTFQFDSDIVDVAVSSSQACALLANRTVICHRRLPEARATTRFSYRLGGLELVSVYVGDKWVCGLSSAGSLACLRDAVVLCMPTDI